MQTGMCLDVFLSKGIEIETSAFFQVRMKVYGYEDRTQMFRFEPDASPETIARVIQHSLGGMQFPEPVEEVFFHNNQCKPETPLPNDLYHKVINYLKDAQTDADGYKVVIQSRVPVVRGI
ncbi:MAG: hypothetical protein PHH00_02805 [Candidatus Nanoarchaeia archaeon]|nr:hypothetical protein [Candidatus Nanoarchaeia archaeon]